MTQVTMTRTAFRADAAGSTGARAARAAGWAMISIGALFLAFDSLGKLLMLAPVVEGTTQLGYPAGVIVPLGIVQLACLILYLVPATSVVGAVLLTGYLGGAIATHVRIESPLFTHILFPVYLAVLLWGGLFLVDRRVRQLVGRR
jgi:hypothetical protein